MNFLCLPKLLRRIIELIFALMIYYLSIFKSEILTLKYNYTLVEIICNSSIYILEILCSKFFISRFVKDIQEFSLDLQPILSEKLDNTCLQRETERERERERQIESKTHQISRSGQTRDIFWSNKFHVDWSINFTIPEMTSNSVDLSWCQRKCSYKIFKW